MQESVLYFALLPSRIKDDELHDMVKLILNSERRRKGPNKLIGLATLDKQTPLARALCHPAVTVGLINLLNKSDQIDDKHLLTAFDVFAHHHGLTPNKPLNYLEPLVARLKKYKCEPPLSPLLHIICRHNNEPLLEWFYENIIKVIDTEAFVMLNDYDAD